MIKEEMKKRITHSPLVRSQSNRSFDLIRKVQYTPVQNSIGMTTVPKYNTTKVNLNNNQVKVVLKEIIVIYVNVTNVDVLPMTRNYYFKNNNNNCG